MKRLLIVLTVLSTISWSCSEDEPTLKNEKQFGGEVSFMANGTLVSLTRNAITVSNGYLSFESYFGEVIKELSFDIYAGIAETSYDVKLDVASVIYYPGDGDSNYIYRGETPQGEIEITEIDEENQTMSGTFSAQLS